MEEGMGIVSLSNFYLIHFYDEKCVGTNLPVFPNDKPASISKD